MSHSQPPSNPQAQFYPRSNIGAQGQPLQQRRRSTSLDIQAVPGENQEQVIQRQQHQRRASAPHASSDWTLDQETALIELMRDELNIQDAADALDRTVEDVTQRWADIKNENKQAARIGHERQRARQELQNRGQLNNSPVTNQAPPSAPAVATPVAALAVAAAVALAVAPAVAPTFARPFASAVAPAVARAVAPATAPAAPKQRRFLQPSRKPSNHNTVPVDAAPEPVPTIARPRGRDWSYIEDIDAGYEEPERRGRELHKDREQLQSLRQPMIPTMTGQAHSAAPAAAHAAQQQKGGAVRPTSWKPASCNPVTGYAAIQSPLAVPAAPGQRNFPQSSHKPANRNAVPAHAAPEPAPEPAPTITRLRGRRWAYVEDIEDECEEAERRSRELQRDRERLQKLHQPIPTVTNQAPSAAPAAAHAAQQQQGGSARPPSRKLTNRNPATGYAANQAPSAALAAQQQKGGSVQSTSRKPANRNLVTGYAAPKPVPEETFLKVQRSPPAPYRLLDSERQGYASGSRSARLRPSHRYRSPTPQWRKDREQGTVGQTNKPAVVQAPNREIFRVPGYSPEPSRRVWTKGHYGWESREIGGIE